MNLLLNRDGIMASRGGYGIDLSQTILNGNERQKRKCNLQMWNATKIIYQTRLAKKMQEISNKILA